MTSFKSFPVRLFDISHHQDDYDTVYKPVFNRMIEAGFMGVMIRVGWGLVTDRMFRYFWSQAKGRLERAPYWYLDYYSHKGTGLSAYDWGVEQAEQCWNALKGDPGEMPLVLDCEEFSGAWRITYLNRGDYRQVMKGFIDRWHQLTGSRPMIYNSPGFFWVFEEWVRELDLWVAWYNRSVTKERVIEYAREKGWKGRVLFWQYTSDGDVNDDGVPDGRRMGFETDALDLNVFLGTVEEYSRYVGTSGVVTPPEPEPVLYRVRVTIPNLLIRSGAGSSYPVVHRYASGEYDVFEERDGYGRIGAGRWIALSYTERVGASLEERVAALEKAVFGG